MYIILTLVMFFTVSLKADNKIEWQHPDGTVKEYDGTEYVVVKRRPKSSVVKVAPTPVPQEVIIQEVEVIKIVEVIKEEPFYKNALAVYGGYGPVGLEHDDQPTVRVKRKELFGLEYRRMLDKRWNVGIQVLTNESYLLGVGRSF